MKLVIKGKVNPPKPYYRAVVRNSDLKKSVVSPFYAKRHGMLSRITGWVLPEMSYKPDEKGVSNFIADSLGLGKYEEAIEREAKSSTYALEAASNVLLEITSTGREALTKMMRVDKSSVTKLLDAILNRINVDIGKQGRPLLAFESEEPYGTGILPMEQNAIISGIGKLPLPDQVRVDMQLHDHYIKNTPNIKPLYKRQLQEDSSKKQTVLDIFEGRNTNPEDIKDSINRLERDREIHRRWATKGGRWGGKKWNNKWISVYDNWIDQLNILRDEILYEVPIISTTAKSPEEPYEMARQNTAPPLLKFTDMKELGQIYFNEFVKSEIKDPQGDTIVFAPRDFLHITKLDTGTADQYRCERLLWIKDIIQNPDLIVKDRRDPGARLFLKWFQGEPYLFICRVTGDHRFHSVTAYPLESPGKVKALLSQEKIYTRPGALFKSQVSVRKTHLKERKKREIKNRSST